jgi:nucleoid-associated protein YgaU
MRKKIKSKSKKVSNTRVRVRKPVSKVKKIAKRPVRKIDPEATIKIKKSGEVCLCGGQCHSLTVPENKNLGRFYLVLVGSLLALGLGYLIYSSSNSDKSVKVGVDTNAVEQVVIQVPVKSKNLVVRKVKMEIGDDLRTLSTKVYGSPKHWKKLYNDNRDSRYIKSESLVYFRPVIELRVDKTVN